MFTQMSEVLYLAYSQGEDTLLRGIRGSAAKTCESRGTRGGNRRMAVSDHVNLEQFIAGFVKAADAMLACGVV